MYVSKLSIENYRSFETFEVKLKQFTQIIGENNIGKSNMLDSLGLIFSQEISFFKKRMLEVSDFHYPTLLKLKRDILNSEIPANEISYPQIKIEAIMTDFTVEQEVIVSDWFTSEECKEASLTYNFSPINSFNSVEEIEQQRQFIKDFKEKLGEDRFATLSEKEILNLINFPISKYQYRIYGGKKAEGNYLSYHHNQLKFELLDALRDAKSELSANRNNGLLYRILNANDEKEYQDLKTQLVGLERAIELNPAIVGIKTRITEQLDKISLTTEKSNNVVDLIFSMPNVSDLLRKLSLIYNDNPIKIERNGMGRNNLLFMSLMLSFIENPEKQDSTFFRIVGIEEPEAHLHANLQNHLARNFQELIKTSEGVNRKDIQLLITSHSNHITTKIDFENTVVLHYEGDEVKAHYILDGFGSTAEDTRQINYLKKYLDSENVNLFYSRRLMLVEGISEKLLLPYFYKAQTGVSIDQSACSIINVNGLAFKNFIKIIENGFHIKCLVLTDSDTGTETAQRAIDLKNKYTENTKIEVQVSAQSTFEKDLIISNTTGSGRLTLCNTLKAVRPVSGKAYVDGLGEDAIDTENYFKLIENYKSEFALQLSISLSASWNGFIIPEYIMDGITFINPTTATEE